MLYRHILSQNSIRSNYPQSFSFAGLGLTVSFIQTPNKLQLEMWANAQRDGRPAKYRWRPLFNAAKFG